MYNSHLIYIIGYILAFIAMKPIMKVAIKDLEGPRSEPSWGCLLVRLLFSLASWITFGLSLLAILGYFIYKAFEGKTIGDPPKWL